MVKLKIIAWKELIKILIKFWAEVKWWKWSHFKVKIDWKNSIIPVHSNKVLWKGLLLSVLKQLDILDNEKYKDTELYKKIVLE